MSLLLKQSTTKVIQFGPFVDATDGVTLETGLVSALDHATTGIKISKNGGAFAVRAATVTASTYDAHGCYRVTLKTTDVNTLGTLRVMYTDATTCLPVWRDFTIVSANVYNSLVGGTDLLDVNTAQWLGTAVTLSTNNKPDVNVDEWKDVLLATTNNLDAAISSRMASYTQPTGFLTATFPTTVASTTNITGGTITTVTNLTNLPSITAGWLTAAGIAAGALDGKGNWNIGKTGYSISGTITTLDGLNNLSSADITSALNTYDAPTNTEMVAAFTEIKGATWNTTDTLEAIRDRGDSAWITAIGFSTHTAADIWTVGTRVLTANTNLNIPTVANIVDGVWDELKSAHTIPNTFGDFLDTEVSGVGGGSLTEAGIADAVWDELLSGHLIGGSTGEALNAAGGAGDPWITALPGSYTSGQAGKIVGDYLNAAITSRSSHNAANVRTEMDSNSTQLAAIVADTNELQGDWANGGRLDLILDARASQSSVDVIDSNVDAILVDTGTSLPGTLSTIAGYIDTEVAAIKTVTDKVDTALELDGAVYRYTTNALEQAPSGGGDATLANQTSILSYLTDIQGAGFDTNNDSLVVIASAGGALTVTQAAQLASINSAVNSKPVIKIDSDSNPAGSVITIVQGNTYGENFNPAKSWTVDYGVSLATATGTFTAKNKLTNVIILQKAVTITLVEDTEYTVDLTLTTAEAKLFTEDLIFDVRIVDGTDVDQMILGTIKVVKVVNLG